ncbi:hypothetical protein D3C84_511970 [compost metagenome]
MVALVHFPAGLGGQGIDRVELQHVDAGVAEAGEEFARRGEGADAVANQVDLHAVALPGDQRLGEALADLVVVEDVGFHVDVVACRADGRHHRLIGLRAVLQQLDMIAGGQRTAGDGLLDRQVQVEDVGGHAAGLDALEDGLAAFG